MEGVTHRHATRQQYVANPLDALSPIKSRSRPRKSSSFMRLSREALKSQYSLGISALFSGAAQVIVLPIRKSDRMTDRDEAAPGDPF